MNVKFREWNCTIKKAEYSNGRIVLQLFDEETGEPVATATVNLPDEECKDNETFIKDYSENCGMLKCLFEANLVEPIESIPISNYVSAMKVRVLI